jgi:hypothetical protein
MILAARLIAPNASRNLTLRHIDVNRSIGIGRAQEGRRGLSVVDRPRGARSGGPRPYGAGVSGARLLPRADALRQDREDDQRPADERRRPGRLAHADPDPEGRQDQLCRGDELELRRREVARV